MATKFGAKWAITRPLKIIARYLHLPPIFGPGLSDGVIFISPLATPVETATKFGTKLTTTRSV